MRRPGGRRSRLRRPALLRTGVRPGQGGCPGRASPGMSRLIMASRAGIRPSESEHTPCELAVAPEARDVPASTSGSRPTGLEGEQEKMRKLRRLGVGGGAALLAAALIAPAGVAHADTTTVTDQYGAAASSQVVDLDILGRHVSFGSADVNSTLDAVTKQVNAEAKGLGTLLVPASQAIARFNDPASVNKACALPQVEQVTGLLSGTSQGLTLPVVGNLLGGGTLSLGGLLPKLDINVGCAEANVGGNADSFLAESVGGLLQVHLAMPQVVSNLAGTVRGLLGKNGVGSLPVVDGLLGNATQNAGAIASVNNALGGILGGDLLKGLPLVSGITNGLNLNTIAPALDPATTVDGLLKSLQDGDL